MEINKIKALNIKSMVLPPGKDLLKVSDGGSLYLYIKPKGKYWYFHYKYNSRTPKTLYLGTWPTLSAADARNKRDICKKLLAEGIDPKIQLNLEKNANIENAANTFRAIAERWLSERKVAPNTHKTDVRCFNKDILPAIGDKPIREITKQDVWDIIQAVQLRTVKGGDTNERVLYRIHKIFEYAIDLDLCENDPTLVLKKHLRPPEKKHRAAITHDMVAFGEFLRVLDSWENQLTPSVFYCLKLSVLVAARSGDIRKMKWKEVDFEKKEWRYSVSKVKTDYVCPLSKQAIEILQTMKELSYRGPDSFVFASPNEKDRCISDGVFHMFFVRSGYQDKQSQHGLRATMQTQLLELGYPKDWTEIALSHDIAKFGGAYDRAAYIEPRRKMLQAWADYLDEIKIPGADVDALFKKYTFSV